MGVKGLTKVMLKGGMEGTSRAGGVFEDYDLDRTF